MSCRTCSEHWDFFGLQVDCTNRRKEGSPAHREPKGAQTHSNQYPSEHSTATHISSNCCSVSFPHTRDPLRGHLLGTAGPSNTMCLSPEPGHARAEHGAGQATAPRTPWTQGSSVLLVSCSETRKHAGFVTLERPHSTSSLLQSQTERQPATSALVGDSQTTSPGQAAAGACGRRRPHESFERENCCAYLQLKVVLHQNFMSRA